MNTKNIFRMLLVAVTLLLGANNVKAEDLWVKTVTMSEWTTEELPYGVFDQVSVNDIIRIYGSKIDKTAQHSEVYIMTNNSNDIFKVNDWSSNDIFSKGYIDFTVDQNQYKNLQRLYNWDRSEEYHHILCGSNIIVTKISLIKGNNEENNNPTVPTLGFPQASYTITYGENFTAPTLTNSQNVAITYSSNNENVAEVNSSTGAVTIKGAGNATITASFAGDDTYNAATASYTLTVNKANVSLSYSAGTASATVGESWTAPTLNNPSGVSVTYSSSNTGVATVSGDGTVTIVAAGTTTITASYAGDNNHNGAQASYTLTVTKPLRTITLGDNEYEIWGGDPAPTHPGEWNLTIDNSSGWVANTNDKTKIRVYVDNLDANDWKLWLGANGWQNANWSNWSSNSEIRKATSPSPYVSSGMYFEFEFGESTKSTLTNQKGLVMSFWGLEIVKITHITTTNEPSALPTPDLTFTSTTATAYLNESTKTPGLSIKDADKELKNIGVTYSSSNTGVATVNAKGELTLVAAGSTIITATSEATEEYASTTASYTLTVYPTGSVPSATANWKESTDGTKAANSSLINNDVLAVTTVYNATTKKNNANFYGQSFTNYLQVRVKDAPSASNVAGTDNGGSTPLVITAKENTYLTVYYSRQPDSGSYESDNGKDLRLVNQSAPTTIISDNTEIIRANSGTGGTGFAVKTYTLDKGNTYTLWAKGTTISLYGISYEQIAEEVTTYTVTVNSQGNGRASATVEEAKEGDRVTITTNPYSGYEVESVTATGASVSKQSENTYYFTMPAQNVTVTVTFKEVYQEPIEYANVSVSSIGYATFSSSSALDFSDVSGLKAYYATSKDANNVYLTQVTGTVAANTGLVLIRDNGNSTTSFSIPKITSGGTDYSSQNLLQPSAGINLSKSDRYYSYYVLVERDGVATFAEVYNSDAYVNSGKAYLQVSKNAARTRSLNISFSDGNSTTGIEELENKLDGETVIYNLRGQRVENPTKGGIYIINGRKVLMK